MSRSLVKAAHQQVLSFLYPANCLPNTLSQSRRSRRLQRGTDMVSTTTPGLEAWFIKSLASAGNCQKHNPKTLHPTTFFSSQRPDVSIRKRPTENTSFRRRQSTKAAECEEAEYALAEPNRTREELMELVDQYDGDSFTDQLPLVELPRLYQPSDGPNITVSDRVEDDWPPPNYTWPADPETRLKIQKLQKSVDDMGQEAEAVYELYRELPKPRAPYLEAKLRHKFLRRLYTVKRKEEYSMLRYLSVVDDLKVSAIPLNTIEWNSALSFVSRYVAKSTEVEVEAALHMWREMEHIAGVKGNDATFNILFDVACKSGKFSLAEMVYKEMLARGIEFNRFHHVSLIQYYGLQKNGDGARAAYKALVDAGEVVDTIVLNAMISALILSYEANAAENVYERMKKMHKERPGSQLPPQGYLKQRRITRTLKRMALMLKIDPTKAEEFQQSSIIAPDLHTYRILVNYFAVTAGELDKTTKILEEMKLYQIPVHGSMFLALLKGFAIHGGIRYTAWTPERLERVWKSYIQIQSEQSDLYFSQWMVIWALRAFAKCSGKSRAIAVWDEIKKKWQPNETELDFVMSNLAKLLEGDDMALERYEWLLGAL